MSEPERAKILSDGIILTSGDRNRSYGEPIQNLGLAGELKRVFRAGCARRIGPAEQEAIDMVLTKISRLGAGQAPGRDTYVDGATYFAIAGEVAQIERDQSWADAA